jgi:aconitate hydratase
MLGQPVYFLTPDVVGVELTGKLREGVTATDLVLTVTEMLRGEGGRQVRRVLRRGHAQRSPCPTAPPSPTWRRSTARRWASSRSTSDHRLLRAPAARRARSALRGLLQGAGAVRRAEGRRDRLQPGAEARPLDRRTQSLAGPKRPQDRIETRHVKQTVHPAVQQAGPAENGFARSPATSTSRSRPRRGLDLRNGDVLIAAITSCTNTSNPGVLLAAGLLAKKAVEGGADRASRTSRPRSRPARASSPSTWRRPACCPTSRSSASTSPPTAAPPASATPAT